jgi:hypothetical protein
MRFGADQIRPDEIKSGWRAGSLFIRDGRLAEPQDLRQFQNGALRGIGNIPDPSAIR